MTRVLMYCNQFHPIVGGAERQAQRQAVALRRLGIDVAILTPRLEPDWPEREEIEGVPVERFKLTDLAEVLPVQVRGLGVPTTLLQGLQIRRAVGRRIGDHDVLHMHLAAPGGCFATAAAHRFGRPAICKIANGGGGFDLPRIDATSVLGPIFRKRLVRELDRFVAISEEIRDDLVSAGVSVARIAMIPNGIDPSQLPVKTPRPRVERFLYLGRLDKCDVETLIAAFALHLAAHPESQLRIVGRGDPECVRSILAKHEGVADHVETPGFSPPLPELEWADAVVHPTRAEGVSNTLLEAMCVGLPCVASDIPPNREVLQSGEAGLLFPPAEVAGLTSCMGRLAEQPSLAATLREAAAKRVKEHYDIERVAERYGRLYQELIRSAEAAGRER